MTTTQVNTRMAPVTIKKLTELAKLYGTVTKAVAAAIDLLYEREVKKTK